MQVIVSLLGCLACVEGGTTVDGCPDPLVPLKSLDEACWRALAEDELRARARAGADTLDRHLRVMPPELVGTEEFPFKFNDPDGVLAKQCGEKISAVWKDSDPQCKEHLRDGSSTVGAPFFAFMRTHVTKVLQEFVKQFKEFRSADGYGKTRWGMTPDEVRKVVPGLKQTMNALTKSDSIAGSAAIVLYVFDANRLTSVGFSFTERHLAPGQYVSDFQKVRKLLISKYGAPDSEGGTVDWGDGQGLDQEAAKNLGVSIALGETQLTTRWHSGATRIVLLCSGDNARASVGLRYESIELEKWTQNRANQAAAKDL